MQLKQPITPVASLLTALFIFAGCGNSSSNSNSTQTKTQLQAIQGPLNYEIIEARFNGGNLIITDDMPSKTAITPAGGIDFAAGILGSLIPESEAVFGPIEAFMGIFNEMEVAAEINELQSEINQLQGEINQLQAEFNAASVFYNNFVLQQQSQWATSSLNFWQSAISSVESNGTSSPGVYNQLVNYMGSQTPNQAAINQNTMRQIQNLSTIYGTNTVAALANSLSGSNFNPSVTPLYKGVQLDVNTTSGNPGTPCSISDSNQTVNLLACQLNYLLTQLPTPATQGSNVVPTLDAYNNQVMMIWQNSLMALQYLYMVEATSSYLNYLNYKAYLGNTITQSAMLSMQISPFELANGMFFSVGTDSDQIFVNSASINSLNVDATFNQYQTNLLLVYAARVNALYQIVMSYAISDQPLASQTYTPPPTVTISGKSITLPQQSSMYKTISTDKLISSVQNKGIPTVAGGVLYQYGGINQLYACTGPNVTQSTTTAQGAQTYDVNLSNCKSAFPDINGSTYDGVNINGYYSSANPTGNQLTLTSNTLNSLTYCASPLSPAIWGAGGVMTCNWGGSGLVASDIMGSDFANSGLIPYIDDASCNNGGACEQPYYTFGNAGDYSYNYYMQYHAKSSYNLYGSGINMNLIASSSGNGQGGVTYGNGNYGLYGSDLNDAEIGETGGPHYALLSSVLPNGYNLPYYFVTYNAYKTGHDYSMLACPSTMGVPAIPGIVSCWQQNNNMGGISFILTDGSAYSMYISESQSQQWAGQGSGVGYLVLE